MRHEDASLWWTEQEVDNRWLVPHNAWSHTTHGLIQCMVPYNAWSHTTHGPIQPMVPYNAWSHTTHGPIQRMVPYNAWSHTTHGPIQPMVNTTTQLPRQRRNVLINQSNQIRPQILCVTTLMTTSTNSMFVCLSVCLFLRDCRCQRKTIALTRPTDGYFAS